MKRRSLLLGLAAFGAWSVPIGAQTTSARRIGVLTPLELEDNEHQSRMAAFTDELQRLGWYLDKDYVVETRSAAGDTEARRKAAVELLSAKPDVILATGGSVVGPLLGVTNTVPIVFTQTPDPVEQRFVASLASPGGNATGFTLLDYGIGTAWVKLLKEIAPGVLKVGVVRDGSISQGRAQFDNVAAASSAVGLQVLPIDVTSTSAIEKDVSQASAPGLGLIITASGLANVHPGLLIGLANERRLPAIYFHTLFAQEGGLMSYGPNSVTAHRQAAGYVDRILKGEQPANLPVQAPEKYDLVLN